MNHPDADSVVPIPDPPMPPSQTSTARVRRARRRSRLTAAALVVGSGAAAATLAYNVMPAAAPASGITSNTTGVGTTPVNHGNGGPHVAHTVATTSASGVTTTTTTRVVNGRTVVTKSTSAPANHDN